MNLERSQNATLDVRCADEPDDLIDHFLSLAMPHAHRWRRLEYIGGSELDGGIKTYLESENPLLVELRMVAGSFEGYDTIRFGGAPQLRTLDFECVHQEKCKPQICADRDGKSDARLLVRRSEPRLPFARISAHMIAPQCCWILEILGNDRQHARNTTAILASTLPTTHYSSTVTSATGSHCHYCTALLCRRQRALRGCSATVSP